MLIAGLVRGAGGDALACHLLKADGQRVAAIEGRGLLAEDLRNQIAEIEILALAGRTNAPLLHIHCDPHPSLSAAANKRARERYWELFEAEFDLCNAPYCGVIHDKHGRRHEHRVYCAVKENGRVINCSFDFLRESAVRARVCFEQGLAAPPSPHLRAVAKKLAKQGEQKFATWALAAAASEAIRRIAKTSPSERQQQERTGVMLESVRAAALSAWHASDDAKTFSAELLKRGLKVARGHRVIVVVDEAGGTHSLSRLIGAASRQLGTRIRAQEVKSRLQNFELTVLAQARQPKSKLAIRPVTTLAWMAAIEINDWEAEDEEVPSPGVPGEDVDLWGIGQPRSPNN